MRLFNLSGTRAFVDGKSRVLWWLCSALLGLMALFGIGSIVALSVKCSPVTFAQASATEHCPNQVRDFQSHTTQTGINDGCSYFDGD